MLKKETSSENYTAPERRDKKKRNIDGRERIKFTEAVVKEF